MNVLYNSGPKRDLRGTPTIVTKSCFLFCRVGNGLLSYH